ncbi:MAG: MotA/TolQ/ExbB proton channel family protein, partial [Gammaproteobacteria bacterium]
SQALMTTVLGLCVAIPLLFGHSIVSSLAENMIKRLDEQSSGLIARLLEGKNKNQKKNQNHE